MPDPRELKVGDLIRFSALPDEWARPGIGMHRDTVRFMKAMIRRTWPARICEFRDGFPWIRARMLERGKLHHHYYMITESTGWRRVKQRKKPAR